MLTDAIRGLYEYNRWAKLRLIEQAAELTPEQLHQPGDAGHGSFRDTILHLMETQRGWSSWWDESMSPMEAYTFVYDHSDYPDAESLQAEFERLSGANAAFIDSLSDETIARDYTFPLPNGSVFRLPLWKMMLHVANHGTQHRSEAAAMLTQFGHSPGDLDLVTFYNPVSPA